MKTLHHESKMRAKNLLTKIKNEIEDIPLPLLLRRIDEVKKKIEEEKYYITVTGPFSAGKSSLLNCLLKEDMLPEGPTPTTCAVTFVHYGQKEKKIYFEKEQSFTLYKTEIDEKRVKIIPENESIKALTMFINDGLIKYAQNEQTKEKISSQQLKNYMDEIKEKTYEYSKKLQEEQKMEILKEFTDRYPQNIKVYFNHEKMKAMESKLLTKVEKYKTYDDILYGFLINRVEVKYPFDILKDVEVVDTPGTHSLIKRHTGIAVDQIIKSDAFIIVAPGQKGGFNKNVKEILDCILNLIKPTIDRKEEMNERVFFVINKKDIPYSEGGEKAIKEIREFVLKWLKDYKISKVYFVSVKNVKEGKEDKEWEKFVSDLKSHLEKKHEPLIKEPLLGIVQEVLEKLKEKEEHHRQMMESLQKRKEALEEEKTQREERLRAEISRLEEMKRIIKEKERIKLEKVEKDKKEAVDTINMMKQKIESECEDVLEDIEIRCEPGETILGIKKYKKVKNYFDNDLRYLLEEKREELRNYCKMKIKNNNVLRKIINKFELMQLEPYVNWCEMKIDNKDSEYWGYKREDWTEPFTAKCLCYWRRAKRDAKSIVQEIFEKFNEQFDEDEVKKKSKKICEEIKKEIKEETKRKIKEIDSQIDTLRKDLERTEEEINREKELLVRKIEEENKKVEFWSNKIGKIRKIKEGIS